MAKCHHSIQRTDLSSASEISLCRCLIRSRSLPDRDPYAGLLRPGRSRCMPHMCGRLHGLQGFGFNHVRPRQPDSQPGKMWIDRRMLKMNPDIYKYIQHLDMIRQFACLDFHPQVAVLLVLQLLHVVCKLVLFDAVPWIFRQVEWFGFRRLRGLRLLWLIIIRRSHVS